MAYNLTLVALYFLTFCTLAAFFDVHLTDAVMRGEGA